MTLHTELKKKKTFACRIDGDDGVEIHPAHSTAGKGFLASLQSLLQMVPDVIVQGIPTVERAVISKDEKDNNRSAAMPCQGLCAVHFALPKHA